MDGLPKKGTTIARNPSAAVGTHGASHRPPISVVPGGDTIRLAYTLGDGVDAVATGDGWQLSFADRAATGPRIWLLGQTLDLREDGRLFPPSTILPASRLGVETDWSTAQLTLTSIIAWGETDLAELVGKLPAREENPAA